MGSIVGMCISATALAWGLDNGQKALCAVGTGVHIVSHIFAASFYGDLTIGGIRNRPWPRAVLARI